MPNLILASSSRYRQALLHRLQLPFTAISPDIDETVIAGETPTQLVERLSIAKAQAILNQHPDAIVIGSDQVSVNAGKILGKPGSIDNAVAQLRAASGKTVQFLTGLAVLKNTQKNIQKNTDNNTQVFYKLVTTTVHFRDLSDTEITAYIAADQPLDCAGSFKSESLGITLFDRIESNDPTALEGLPLIQLSHFLRDCGFSFGKAT